MAAYAPRRSSGPVLRSASPSKTFSSGHSSPFASAFRASGSLNRPSAAVPVKLCQYSSPSLSFSMDRSISVSTAEKSPATASRRRACMCSPTNHPGSFKCSLHKTGLANGRVSGNPQTASCGSPSRLNMRRSAMKNSLVRIGTVEGDLVKRALAALIRPTSHHQRRRGEFQSRPSRLSVVSSASGSWVVPPLTAAAD